MKLITVGFLFVLVHKGSLLRNEFNIHHCDNSHRHLFYRLKKIEKELDDCNAWYLCIVPSNGSKDKVVFRSIADRDLTMVGTGTRSGIL